MLEVKTTIKLLRISTKIVDAVEKYGCIKCHQSLKSVIESQTLSTYRLGFEDGKSNRGKL